MGLSVFLRDLRSWVYPEKSCSIFKEGIASSCFKNRMENKDFISIIQYIEASWFRDDLQTLWWVPLEPTNHIHMNERIQLFAGKKWVCQRWRWSGTNLIPNYKVIRYFTVSPSSLHLQRIRPLNIDEFFTSFPLIYSPNNYSFKKSWSNLADLTLIILSF